VIIIAKENLLAEIFLSENVLTCHLHWHSAWCFLVLYRDEQYLDHVNASFQKLCTTSNICYEQFALHKSDLETFAQASLFSQIFILLSLFLVASQQVSYLRQITWPLMQQ